MQALTLRQLEITLADFRANGWQAMDAESRAILNAYWHQNKNQTTKDIMQKTEQKAAQMPWVAYGYKSTWGVRIGQFSSETQAMEHAKSGKSGDFGEGLFVVQDLGSHAKKTKNTKAHVHTT